MADVMLNTDQINKVPNDIITRLVRESLAGRYSNWRYHSTAS